MNEPDFATRLQKCKTIGDTFDLVKEIAYRLTGLDQAGIMVGLSDLGKFPKGFLGAYYSPASNMIVINSRVLHDIALYRPDMASHYLFFILLHEYVHSLGIYDEAQARRLVYEISEEIGDHIIIKMAKGIEKHFPELVTHTQAELPVDQNIYFAKGIDRRYTDYIG